MIAKLLISTSSKLRVERIQKILSEHNLPPNHPDLFYFPSDSKLGIDEARKIKIHFSLKPYSAKGRAVVLEDASQLTVAAQNALLKTLEELPKDALFILGAESDANLLPTVISRSQIIRLSDPTSHRTSTSEVGVIGHLGFSKEFSKDLENLLESNIETRFEYIERLKDREEFLHAMVQYFRKLLYPQRQTYHDRDINVQNIKGFLEELLQAEEWAKQNVNIRAILEYLMLKMPSA